MILVVDWESTQNIIISNTTIKSNHVGHTGLPNESHYTTHAMSAGQEGRAATQNIQIVLSKRIRKLKNWSKFMNHYLNHPIESRD